MKSQASGNAITTVIPDKEYLLTGYVTPDYEAYHAKVMKIDGQGKTIWKKEYDHGAGPEAHAGLILPGGSALIVSTTGKTNKFGQGKTDGWLFIVDSEGKKLRETILPDGKIHVDGNLAAFNDNRIAVVFSKSQLPPIDDPLSGTDHFDAMVTGLDLDLKKQWELKLKGYTMLQSPLIWPHPENGYIVAGGTEQGVRLTRISADGKLLSNDDVPLAKDKGFETKVSSGAQTVDGLVLTGTYEDSENGDFDEKVFFLKLDSRTLKIQKCVLFD